MLLILLTLAAGCGSAPDLVPAVSDGMSCAEVAEVVEGAIARGQQYIAAQRDDPLLAADLIFALSGAEERPECVEDDIRSRASGMRATIGR